MYVLFFAGVAGCCSFASVAEAEGSGVDPKSGSAKLQIMETRTGQLRKEADSFRVAPTVDPLFATWLNHQYTIQKRLIHIIEKDLSKGTRAARRAESELNDLRYMQSRIAGEIAYLKNLPPDDGSVVDVRSCGAVGDGVTDDGAAIARAIAIARASGSRTVFFPKGKYYVGEEGVPKGGSAHVQLKGLDNLLFKGEDGTGFIFGNPLRPGVQVLDCNNVRLENFSIEYRPIPYTLGTVVKEVENGYVLKIKEGFPAPTEPYFRANDFHGLSRFFTAALQPGSPRPVLSSVSSHLAAPDVVEVSPSEFLFKYSHAVPRNLMGLNVCFQSRMFSGMAVEILESKRCRVGHVRVYGSPAMAFLSNGSDMTFFNHCSLGPLPGMEGFASSNADGIFVRDALMGGLISGNSIRYNGDDFFNVHNHTRPAYQIKGKVVYLKFWTEKLLRKGHRLGWIRASVGEKHVSGEAFIEKVETVGELFKVTCDRELPPLVTTSLLGSDPSDRPDYLCIMEAQFNGGVVTGNTFSHGLSRFLLGGRNWLFTDNVIEDSLNNSFLFTFGPRPMGQTGGEGVQSRNILVARNRMACQTKTVFSFPNVLNPGIKVDDLLTTTHIDIKDNEITLLGEFGDRPFAVVDDASMVNFSGNRITNLCDSIAPAFELQDCEDVVLEGNSIVGNFTQLYSSESGSVLASTLNSFENTPIERTVFKSWDFSRATDLSEWRSNAVLNDMQFVSSTNTLRLKVTGSDPYIKFPPFPTRPGIRCVSAEINCPGFGNNLNQLYWETGLDGFSEEKSRSFSRGLNESQQNGFNIYNFLLGLDPLWSEAAVKGLRLDLFRGIPAGSLIDVRRIALSDGPIY